MILREYITVADELDRDGEMDIEIDRGSDGSVTIWIDKKDAEQIVNHLADVFNLKGSYGWVEPNKGEINNVES